jgi:spore maturation protein CgeB
MLTGQADNLDAYYWPGTDIAVFRSADELGQVIHHYLADEDQRATIAHAGYERTLREHTYVHRFHEIFTRMGLPFPSVEDALTGKIRPGLVEHMT